MIKQIKSFSEESNGSLGWFDTGASFIGTGWHRRHLDNSEHRGIGV